MKYLLALDEADTSETAFDWLASVVQKRDEVVLIICVQPMYGYASMGTPGHETYVDKGIQKHKLWAETLLQTYVQRLDSLGIKHSSSIVETGDPKALIPKKVEELKIGTLVLGSRGLGAFERLFMSSFSEYCLHNVNCAVAIIKSNANLHLPTT